MIVMGIWTTVIGFFITTSIFSIFSASLGPVLAECTYIVCGSDLFTFGYGYVLVAMGLGSMIGPPIAGKSHSLVCLKANGNFLYMRCLKPFFQTENFYYFMLL